MSRSAHVNFRIEPELRDVLEACAKHNNISLSQEIVARLKGSFQVQWDNREDMAAVVNLLWGCIQYLERHHGERFTHSRQIRNKLHTALPRIIDVVASSDAIDEMQHMVALMPWYLTAPMVFGPDASREILKLKKESDK